MDNDDIKRRNDEINAKPVDDFDGLSAAQMHVMLYSPFSPDSIVQFNDKISDDIIRKIPLYGLLVSFLIKIKSGDDKLTTRGNLSTSIVKSLYSGRFIKEKMIDSGLTKLSREESSMSIHLIHILAEISGLIWKTGNKLTLTEKAMVILDNPYAMIQELFLHHVFDFNLGYFDNYPETHFGAQDISYTLYLLDKYGDRKRPTSFYADKLIKAFPEILTVFDDKKYVDAPTQFHQCMHTRIFNRVLHLYGLISGFTVMDDSGDDVLIQKTKIFDQLFKIIY